MWTILLQASSIAASEVLCTSPTDLRLRRQLAHLLWSDRARARQEGAPRPCRDGEQHRYRFSNGSICRMTFNPRMKTPAYVRPATIAA